MKLAGEVASALKWSLVGKLGTQLISWAVTLLVIRLLTPADYGLLAIATAFVSLITLLGEAGAQLIIVRARELSEAFMRSVWGLVLLTHLLMTVVIALASYPVARYYDDVHIQPIMMVIGLNALLLAFTQIPGALLLREMDFRRQAMVALVASIGQSGTTLGLAYLGAGVWSLVAGQLVSNAMTALMLNWLRPNRRLPSFDFSLVREDLKFGFWIVVQRVTWWLINSFDQLLLGKLIGPLQLGFYTVANQLAALPKEKLSQTINQVAFPAVVRVQDDPKRLRSNLLTALSIMSTVVFPIFAIISAMAQEIVSTLLSAKWQGSVVPLTLLPLAMPFRMVTAPLAETLNAMGHASLTARLQASSLIFVATGISLGAQWGVAGVCIAWILIAHINLAMFLIAARKFSGVTYLDGIGVMMGPIACCALMYFGLWAISRWPSAALPVVLEYGPTRLVIICVIAATVYSASSLVLNRRGVRNLAALLARKGQPS